MPKVGDATMSDVMNGLTTAEAKHSYFLTPKDLKAVPFKSSFDGFGCGAPTRFYNPDDLKQVALKKHGGEAGLDKKRAAREKRESAKRRREELAEEKEKEEAKKQKQSEGSGLKENEHSKRERLNRSLMGRYFYLIAKRDGKHVGNVSFASKENIVNGDKLAICGSCDECLWIDELGMYGLVDVNSNSNITDEWQEFDVTFKVRGDHIDGTFSVKVGDDGRTIEGHYSPNDSWTKYQDFALA